MTINPNKLNVSNFFHHYLFNPLSKNLNKADRIKALLGTICLGFTLGIGHAVCRIFFYEKNITVGKNSDSAKKTSEVGEEAIIKKENLKVKSGEIDVSKKGKLKEVKEEKEIKEKGKTEESKEVEEKEIKEQVKPGESKEVEEKKSEETKEEKKTDEEKKPEESKEKELEDKSKFEEPEKTKTTEEGKEKEVEAKEKEEKEAEVTKKEAEEAEKKKEEEAAAEKLRKEQEEQNAERVRKAEEERAAAERKRKEDSERAAEAERRRREELAETVRQQREEEEKRVQEARKMEQERIFNEKKAIVDSFLALSEEEKMNSCLDRPINELYELQDKIYEVNENYCLLSCLSGEKLKEWDIVQHSPFRNVDIGEARFKAKKKQFDEVFPFVTTTLEAKESKIRDLSPRQIQDLFAFFDVNRAVCISPEQIKELNFGYINNWHGPHLQNIAKNGLFNFNGLFSEESKERFASLSGEQMDVLIGYLEQEHFDLIDENQFKKMRLDRIRPVDSNKLFPTNKNSSHPHKLTDVAMRRVKIISEKQFHRIEIDYEADSQAKRNQGLIPSEIVRLIQSEHNFESFFKQFE